ncbi:MAG: SprT-like domain-containing protein [Pirellulales bacterium]|nr:SprT-like domain-containing protein [Pirellulales bacterium]
MELQMDLAAAQRMAQLLMRKHGLFPEWKFEFDRAVLRFGSCQWRRKKITLSAYLTALNDDVQVRDTILHEIAHALAPPRAGHGKKWRQIAQAIGCNAMRCYGEEVIAPKPKFIGTCPSCSMKVGRNRRDLLSCAKCDRRFNPKYLLVWDVA